MFCHTAPLILGRKTSSSPPIKDLDQPCLSALGFSSVLFMAGDGHQKSAGLLSMLEGATASTARAFSVISRAGW